MDKENIQKMAWNEPGGSNNKDPWGCSGKSGGGSPPDLDEMLKKFKDKFGGFSGGSLPGGFGFILIGVVILWLLTGIYIVDPAERGVELRFGKYSTTTGPGPHWHLPYPIEKVEIVNVDRIQNLEIGYRSGSGRLSGSVYGESLMLTKDENIIDTKFAVQYKIKSAKDYLFNIVQPDTTLREVTESAVRDIVGKSKMDFVLTEGRAEIADRAKNLIQKIMDNYGSGLLVTSVNMQDAQPPEQVQDAFDDVVKAREDKQKFINQAEAYRNDILPKARGKAARIVAEANAYKEQIVAKAEGEAARFSQILQEYAKAPDVTRERMYLETMEQVLGRTGKLIMDQSSNNLMMMPLDKMLSGSGMLPKPAMANTRQSVVNNSPAIKREAERKVRSLREGR